MILRNKILLFLFFISFLLVFFYLKFFQKINTNDIKSIKTYTEEKIKKEEYTSKEDFIQENKNENTLKNIEKEETETEDKKENQKNIDYIKIKTPFISQAPKGKWDPLHEEACEEASLLIIKYHSEKRELILSDEAEKDIQAISNYVKENFSDKHDLNIAEVQKLAEEYLGIKNSKIIKDPKIDEIEKELSFGNLIVAPMAGRKLNNPFFKNPGPPYHMLVISGFDRKKKEFITQDPGTKRGKDFIYKYEIIMDSIHDFLGIKENILSGEKIILVFQN